MSYTKREVVPAVGALLTFGAILGGGALAGAVSWAAAPALLVGAGAYFGLRRLAKPPDSSFIEVATGVTRAYLEQWSSECRQAIAEMRLVARKIGDPDYADEVNALCAILDNIVFQVQRDPSDLGRVGAFKPAVERLSKSLKESHEMAWQARASEAVAKTVEGTRSAISDSIPRFRELQEALHANNVQAIDIRNRAILTIMGGSRPNHAS